MVTSIHTEDTVSPLAIIAEYTAATMALELYSALNANSLDTPEKRLAYEIDSGRAWSRWNKAWHAKNALVEGIVTAENERERA